jgi:hypothetical protein
LKNSELSEGPIQTGIFEPSQKTVNELTDIREIPSITTQLSYLSDLLNILPEYDAAHGGDSFKRSTPINHNLRAHYTDVLPQ